MDVYKKKFQTYYATHKRNVWAGLLVLSVVLLMIIGAFVIRANRANPPSATIAYSTEGFAPSSLTLLVDEQGTNILFVNDSNEKLDISESSSNPEVFQVGILESKNITKPKKVHVSKPGIYTFTNNKNSSQSAVIEVITTEQLQNN